MGILFTAVNMFFQVLTTLILLYALMSWFCPPGSKLFDFYMRMGDFVEPLIRPWRRLTQGLAYRTGMDFAPFIAILALQLLNTIAIRLMYAFLR